MKRHAVSQSLQTCCPYVQSPSRAPKQAGASAQQEPAVVQQPTTPIPNDAALRKHCSTPVAFQLQTRRSQSAHVGPGKAHLAPGMHFKDQDAPGTVVFVTAAFVTKKNVPTTNCPYSNVPLSSECSACVPVALSLHRVCSYNQGLLYPLCLG